MIEAIKTYPRTRKTVFWLSFFLHLLIALYLFGFLHHHHKQCTTPVKQDRPLSWASTKARSGAPIVLVNMQQPQPIQASTQKMQQQQPQPKHEQLEQKHRVTPRAYKKAAQTFFAQHSSSKPIEKQPSTQQQQPHEQISQPTQKPFPTLQQIARSFSRCYQQEGEHTITVHGDPRRAPTEQQLKQHHYVEKMLSCLHASYVTMRDGEPRGQHMTNPTLSLRIHRDGSISDIRITSSSRNELLDFFYMKLFADAGRSFPPLPSYFEHDSYVMNWIIALK